MFVHTGSGVSGRSDGCRASVYLLGLFLGALSVTLLVFAIIMLNGRQPLNLRASNSKHLILFLLQAGLVFRSSHSDCESFLISGTQATAAVTPGACFAMAGAEAHEIKPNYTTIGTATAVSLLLAFHWPSPTSTNEKLYFPHRGGEREYLMTSNTVLPQQPAIPLHAPSTSFGPLPTPIPPALSLFLSLG